MSDSSYTFTIKYSKSFVKIAVTEDSALRLTDYLALRYKVIESSDLHVLSRGNAALPVDEGMGSSVTNIFGIVGKIQS